MNVKSEKIERIDCTAYKIPSDFPGGDGTGLWDSVTMVVVQAESEDCTGIGYTYADTSVAAFIRTNLLPILLGASCMSVPASWSAMNTAVRDLGGHTGLSQMAISAVDTALWDLKARLLGRSLVDLIGSVRESCPIYGSGGYVTYDKARLQEQLGDWARRGIRKVKMKIGRSPEDDVQRVSWARDAIGAGTGLMVNANGAYQRKQSLAFASKFLEFDVCWFEEPVPSDDLIGLRHLRERMPDKVEVAAGEYGYGLSYFRRMIEGESIDVLQADASRCGGFTNFLKVDSLCQSRNIPLSAHCAPTLHAQVACCAPMLRDIEYFHDHVNAENTVFDGVIKPDKSGTLSPDRSQPGNGLTLKRTDAEKYRCA